MSLDYNNTTRVEQLAPSSNQRTYKNSGNLPCSLAKDLDTSTARTYIIIEIEALWVSTITCTKYGYMHIKPNENIHKNDNFFRNMLTHFKTLMHTQDSICKRRNHYNIRHVHNQDKHQHKVILAYDIHQFISTTYKILFQQFHSQITNAMLT